MTSPSDSSIQAESEAASRWEFLSDIEEHFLRQRSKLHWLKVGDRNNYYFYNSLKSRQGSNTISEILNEDGHLVNDLEQIKEEAVNHFKNFLNHTQSNVSAYDETELSSLIRYRCSQDIAERLIAPVSDEEIKQTLFSMSDNKSPGPDGFTSEFFIASWEILGRDFIVAIRSFFENGFLPKGINTTILALIPKKSEANTLKDYRPISCCNVLYKVISRLIANRLKSHLPQMISCNQTAFVKERLLMENVLLASEIVHDYHKSSISPRCALMLDISKAFDSVRWDFILDILRVMQIPQPFVEWIKQCITTASFSVQINGSLAGFFGSSRGLRQGCSLSPYLFVICIEVLTSLLNDAAREGRTGYHPRCQDLGVTHLSFADDILVFLDANRDSMDNLLMILQRFESMSGLRISMDKSTLFVGGMDDMQRQAFHSHYAFAAGILPVRYLGLPLLTKRMGVEDYKTLLERIKKRLQSWNSRYLSYAGRVQLISSVIFGMVNFWQMAYHLPSKCLKDIESLCSSFLWSGPSLEPKRARVAWEHLCKTKDEGGLGLRPLREVRTTNNLKLVWRILSKQKSMWVRWVTANVLKGKSFWSIRNSQVGSWIIKKLLKVRELARSFHRVEIRSGRNTSFWYDSWSERGCLLDLVGQRGTIDMGIPLTATVESVLRARRRRIHRAQIYNDFEESISRLTSTTSQTSNLEDEHLWRNGLNTFSSTFNSKKTWLWFREVNPRVPWRKIVWFKHATPKYSFIQWLAHLERLPTTNLIRIWNPNVDGLCVLCKNATENRNHLFFRCNYSEAIWRGLVGRLLGQRFTSHWDVLQPLLALPSVNKLERFILHYSFQSTLYQVWMERNRRRHGQQERSEDVIVSMLKRIILNRLMSIQEMRDERFQFGVRFWFSITDM